MAKVIHKIMRDIGIIAPLIMWNIWCSRNKIVFDNIQPDMLLTAGIFFPNFIMQAKPLVLAWGLVFTLQ